MRQKIKAIAIDMLGVLMLIGAAAFGWLPGPGGVPLLLGGLSLLSIRHKWAKDLLNKIKNGGSSVYEMFFPNNKLVHFLYDLLSLTVAASAVYLLQRTTKNSLQTVSVMAICVAAGLFVTNRRRLERISKWIASVRKKT